jgi:hypothetical protein
MNLKQTRWIDNRYKPDKHYLETWKDLINAFGSGRWKIMRRGDFCGWGYLSVKLERLAPELLTMIKKKAVGYYFQDDSIVFKIGREKVVTYKHYKKQLDSILAMQESVL